MTGVGIDLLEIGRLERALERRPNLAKDQQLLAAALAFVGHAQTRSRGTVCGSVAHADPSAELPLVLVARAGNAVLADVLVRRSQALRHE